MNHPTTNKTATVRAVNGVSQKRSEYDAFLADMHDEENGHLDIDTVLRDHLSYDDRDLAAINNDDEGDDATLLSLYETANAAGAERKCVYKARSLEYHTQQSLSGHFNRSRSGYGTFGQTSSPAYAGQMHTSIAYDLSYFIYSEYFLRPYNTVREALAEDVVAQRLKQGTAQIFAFLAYAKHELAERHAEFIAMRQARREAKRSLIAEKKQALQKAAAATPVAMASKHAYATQVPHQENASIKQHEAPARQPVPPQDEHAPAFALADILPTDDAYHRYFDVQTSETTHADITIERPQEIKDRKLESIRPIVAAEATYEETQEPDHTVQQIGLITPSKPPIDYDAWAREISGGVRALFARMSTTASSVMRDAQASPEYTTPAITHEATIVNQRLVARAPSNAHERRFPTARVHDAIPEYAPDHTMVRDAALDIRDEQLSAIEQSTRVEDLYEYSEEPVVLRKPARSTFAFSVPCDPIGIDRTPRRVLRKKRSGIVAFLDGITRINSWAFIKLAAGIWLVTTVLVGLLKTVGVLAF